MLDVFGVTSGSPWSVAADLLQKWVDPDIYEQVGGSYLTWTPKVWSEAIIPVRVTGSLEPPVIKTFR